MRGCIIILVALVAAALAAGVAIHAGNRHDAKLGKDYQLVLPGMSTTQVQTILGQPSWRGECGAGFPYGYGEDCVAELGYRSAFAPIVPRYWVVELDSGERVIRAVEIVSP
jgi:hypothetical protein